MSQFVRQRESLFFVGVARVNKDYAFPPVGQQASMQAAILPTDAMSNLDAPRPGQNVIDTQGWNRVDLQRQRQGNRCFDIAGEPAGSVGAIRHFPEFLGHILDKVGINGTIHRMTRIR